MTTPALIACSLCVIVSALDSLCDRHFGDSLTSKWRRPRRILWISTDLWHVAKWGRFYPPLIGLLWFACGFPWASWASAGWWAGATVASWAAWRWGSPWKSLWLSKM